MDADKLWPLEKRFWLEGAPVYEAKLHEDAVMIFPGAGLLNRAAIIESLRDAPRWTAVDISGQRTLPADGAVVLAYAAEARREEDPPYRAFCSSLYIRADGGWKMLFHQQTQVAKIAGAT